MTLATMPGPGLGTTLVAPRGGETVTVTMRGDDGTILATGDGRMALRFWHQRPAHPDAEPVYYEVLAGPERGAHGWVCSECRFVVQTG